MHSTCYTLLLLYPIAFARPSHADDRRGDRGRDRDREEREGPRTKFENNSEHYKYEYRARSAPVSVRRSATARIGSLRRLAARSSAP